MTPRKELFIKIKEQLQSIEALELIDLYRGQFENPNSSYGDIWTAALIRIGRISYETMTEHIQEGTASVDVLFYCKDGWTDQHNTTADDEHGLLEIDVLDEITDTLQFLQGEQFKPLELTEDDTEGLTADGIMSYRVSFSTRIYRRTRYDYTPIKLQLKSV